MIFLALVPAAADDREVQVNVTTSQGAFSPVVEALDAGGFLVVWRGRGTNLGGGSEPAISGRRLDAQALPVGEEFRIDIATSSLSLSKEPKIAKLSDGRFVVAWQRFSDPTFRFLSSDGSPLGDEIEVVDLNVLDSVSVAPAPDGGFLLAWDCNGSACGGEAWDSFVQRFDSTGQEMTDAAFLNIGTSDSQLAPRAISLDNQGFLVVWRDVQGIIDSLRLRRLDVDGEFLGGEVELDVPIDDVVNFAVDAEGDRLVAAFSEFGEEERDTMTLFRFDTFGNRIGQEFVVSVDHPYQLLVERAKINASGDIDVVGLKQANAGPNNLNRDVVAFQFDFDTGLQGANFQVNSVRSGDQYRSDSIRTNDTFLIVWTSEGSLGTDNFAQSIQVRSSFETLFIDGFESGVTMQWHEAIGLP